MTNGGAKKPLVTLVGPSPEILREQVAEIDVESRPLPFPSRGEIEPQIDISIAKAPAFRSRGQVDQALDRERKWAFALLEHPGCKRGRV